MRNQRFEDAQRCLHLVFDPTATLEAADLASPDSPARFWRVKPLRQLAAQPPTTLAGLLQSEVALAPQVEAWRASPFDPFALAETRPVALMKATVTAYLDNLIA